MMDELNVKTVKIKIRVDQLKEGDRVLGLAVTSVDVGAFFTFVEFENGCSLQMESADPIKVVRADPGGE
jgi:hypothetical protein